MAAICFYRYYVYTLNGSLDYFGGHNTKPSDWFRLTLVYDPYTALTIYHDASVLGEQRHLRSGSYTPGTGQVVFGRGTIDLDFTSSSIMVDELTLWHRKLSSSEVQDIYNENGSQHTASGFGSGIGA